MPISGGDAGSSGPTAENPSRRTGLPAGTGAESQQGTGKGTAAVQLQQAKGVVQDYSK